MDISSCGSFTPVNMPFLHVIFSAMLRPSMAMIYRTMIYRNGDNGSPRLIAHPSRTHLWVIC